MIDTDGLESGQVLISGAWIPSADWIVVAEQPKAVVLGPVYKALTSTAFLVLLGLLAAMLMGYWLARRLAGPILQLRRGAEKIALGDLAARISVSTRDEIEDLAREFNRMASQLQDYTTGLE